MPKSKLPRKHYKPGDKVYYVSKDTIRVGTIKYHVKTTDSSLYHSEDYIYVVFNNKKNCGYYSYFNVAPKTAAGLKYCAELLIHNINSYLKYNCLFKTIIPRFMPN